MGTKLENETGVWMSEKLSGWRKQCRKKNSENSIRNQNVPKSISIQGRYAGVQIIQTRAGLA
jgi:hypothetical protein